MSINRITKRTQTISIPFALEKIDTIIEPLQIDTPLLLIDQQLIHIDLSKQKYPVKKIDCSLDQQTIVDSLKNSIEQDNYDALIVVGDQYLIDIAKLTALSTPLSLLIIPTSFNACNNANGIITTIREENLVSFNSDSIIPTMTILDESTLGLLSVEKKSLDIYALMCSIIDILALCEVNSYQYNLALEAFRLCYGSATSAAHSQHQQSSRQEILAASTCLSLARGEERMGLLDTMATTLSSIGNANYSLIMTIIFPYIFETLFNEDLEVFAHLYQFFSQEPFTAHNCKKWIRSTLQRLLIPIEQNIPKRLYDVKQRSSNEKALSISSLERAATIIAESRCVCSYPNLLLKQDISALLERSYWGYESQEEYDE